MAFPMVDTPRTEVADKTLLSHVAELDFSTVNSFPSPSKDRNDLIRNMRNKKSTVLDTPRARPPLGDRRNVPSKGEFTPLLKSAARNRMMQLGGSNKENSHLETPAGLKPTYNHDSPALPLNSSILNEEHTGSSVDAAEGQGTPIPPISSSLMSTPIPTLPTRRDGILDDNANLLTLREQEARLIQIDKENFSLKLKIHFMEEALRRNGKEFNEAAIKENTELKVDKVTLQRDLRQYRKSLAQAEKGLEDYRRQLVDYADKVKRRHATEGLQEEVDRLSKLVSEKELELEDLRRGETDSKDHKKQLEALNDHVEDLEAELRERDRVVDEKDDELERLQAEIQTSENGLEGRMQDNERELKSKDNHIGQLEQRIQELESEKKKIRQEKDAEVTSITDRHASLQNQLESINKNRSDLLSTRDEDILQRNRKINNLQTLLVEAEEKAANFQRSQEEFDSLKSDMLAEIRSKSNQLKDKDHELDLIQLKLDTAENRDEKAEKLQDNIDDLEQELREKNRIIEEKEDQMDALRDLDEALIEAHDKIHELETQRDQNLKELQDMRNDNSRPQSDSQALIVAQDRIHELEELRLNFERRERDLHLEINQLRSQITILRQEFEDKEAEFATDREIWGNERKSLEIRKVAVEKQICGLQLTLDDVRESQGDRSDIENKLQRMIEDIQKEKIETERDLGEKIENLEDEVEVLQCSLDEVQVAKDDLDAMRQESEGLQRQIKGFKQDLARSEKELEILRSRQKSTSPSFNSNDRRQTVEDLQETLSQVRKERNDLQARLSEFKTAKVDAKAEVDILHVDLENATSSRDQLQLLVKDLRDEVRNTKRDSERKFAESERDIQNLEQDLADMQSNERILVEKNNSLEAQISQLKSNMQGLEQDVDKYRSNAQIPEAKELTEATAVERKELHALLKDAKLETEDLVLQLQDRDARLKSTIRKETELREQLKRVRDERSAQASRADEVSRELEDLQNGYEKLVEELAKIQQQMRLAPSTNSDTTKTGKRHAAELRGLARQIEYLTARVRREESFRRDLSHAKAYFLKQVEMYTACNAVDLRLVGSMGIPVVEVLEEEQRRKGGRKVTCLRSVVCMVLAAIRMKKGAERWGVIKGRHESVLQKLEEVRKARLSAKKKGKALLRQ